jgi:hypothetical protein
MGSGYERQGGYGAYGGYEHHGGGFGSYERPIDPYGRGLDRLGDVGRFDRGLGRFDRSGGFERTERFDRPMGYGSTVGSSPDAPRRVGRFEDRPFMGKGPKGYARSDERIREDVCDCLSEGWVDASNVDVQVKNGCVTLTGQVPERGMKRAIEDMVEGCRGVTDVDNQIRIPTSRMGTASNNGERDEQRAKVRHPS